MPHKVRNTVETFWSGVDKGQDNECWNWTRCVDTCGYGQIMLNKQKYNTHRLAYMLTKGEIPQGKVIMHTCDNPRCCNPAHLVATSQRENMLDKVRKGRNNNQRGERIGTSKLTRPQVDKIRELYANGGISYGQLGKMFGVSDCQVGHIIRGTYWK